MSLWGQVTKPYRGALLLRRLLVELRGMRRAQERQADALELAAGLRDRQSVGGQAFRAYSHAAKDLKDIDLRGLTEVTYADSEALAAAEAKREELRAVLGYDPSPEQVLGALEGREP